MHDGYIAQRREECMVRRFKPRSFGRAGGESFKGTVNLPTPAVSGFESFVVAGSGFGFMWSLP